MTPPRLLVLDDDEAVGELLVAIARHAGCEARLCVRPQAFFDAVAQWAPTHVAIDLTMPEMDGLTVVRRLAADACAARIIVASGADGVDAAAALQLATDLGLRTAGVLSKPFLMRTVRALLASDADPAVTGRGA